MGDRGKDKGSAEPGPKIHISNLPKDIQQEALSMVFTTYGKINEIHILPPKHDSPQLAAFITYQSTDSAKTAIAAMESGYEIRPGEGNIIVKYARSSSSRDGGGRYNPY